MATEAWSEGGRLSGLGKYEEALPSLKESLRLHRSIKGRPPDEHALLVAGALNNIGFCLAKLKQYGPAIKALEEARQLCEPLSTTTPPVASARFLLANVLGSLGISLYALGKFKQAVPITEDLVPLRRSFTTPGPLAIDSDLAKALRLFAIVRASAGLEGEGAILAATEALTIFQHLAQEAPQVYGGN